MSGGGGAGLCKCGCCGQRESAILNVGNVRWHWCVASVLTQRETTGTEINAQRVWVRK